MCFHALPFSTAQLNHRSSLRDGVYNKVGLLFEGEVALLEVVGDGVWPVTAGDVAEVFIEHFGLGLG